MTRKIKACVNYNNQIYENGNDNDNDSNCNNHLPY